MKKEIKSEKLIKALEERQKVLDNGYPIFDNIEEIVTEVVKNNISKIATDADLWKFLRAYIEEKEYNEANAKLKEEYRQLQKMEYKMERLKEKVSSVVEKENIKLKEFEIIGSINLEDGKAYVEIIDQVESYKEMLREKKK